MLSWLGKLLIARSMARAREGDIGPTLRMDAGPPRSTRSHWSSPGRLLQRVVVRPSSAAAGALAPSVDEALTSANCEIGVPAGGSGVVVPVVP